MNRRVLLIDSDPAFSDTLTRELARYKVVVMTEADADRALTLAQADAPALVLLCIEEADKKAGFRVFEKFKKGALSKVPVILLTATMPVDSFAKHRNLKAHADEYIDKRSMSTHELVGKIDGLIGLGDPEEEEDLSIPVEDDIPMEIAEGDVVLDEVVGDLEADQPALLAHEPYASEPEAHDEFDQNDLRTVGPEGLTVDSVVEAETDAAFDALMGGFGDDLGEPAADDQAVAEQGETREQSAAIPPIEPEPNPVDLAVEGVVPEPILDGRGRGTTPPPLLAESVPGIIIDRPSVIDEGGSAARGSGRGEIDDNHHGRTQAIPPLRDVEAIPEPVEHQEPQLPAELREPAPEPIHDDPHVADPLVADALSGTVDIGMLSDLADQEMPPEAPPEMLVEQHTDIYASDVAEEETSVSGHEHERLESSPAIAIDDDELVPLDDDVEVPLEIEEPSVAAPLPEAQAATQPLPPIVPADAPVPSRTGRAGSHSQQIDLGLEAVAQDAESEQSGVYDRRALRKIGELERQIAQLKTELERARTAGETAAKGGRESQFLHLRESMLAKDKELKQLKSDLASKDSDLAEASEKLRQAVTARGSLEQKQAELERRANDEGTRAQKLAAASKTSENQIAQLQGEVDRLSRAASTSETARLQLEKDLATERATGKEYAVKIMGLPDPGRPLHDYESTQACAATRALPERRPDAAVLMMLAVHAIPLRQHST
ncbi:MAG TPA: response regulator [Kofleriaceae bacterium]